MALSNYDKQKRWREKNRALYNFQQRQRRKNLSGGVESRHARRGNDRELLDPGCLESVAQPLSTSANRGIGKAQEQAIPIGSGSSAPPAQTSKDETLEKLRGLVKLEEEKPAVELPVKPVVYRSDFGAVITERQWNQLQEKKKKAKEGGYEIDAYSQ